MSHVTNLILIPGSGNEESEDGGPPAWLAHLDAAFQAAGQHAGMLAQVNQRAGGRKHMEADVYMGAFNYFCLESIDEVLESAPWADRMTVQYLVKEQGDETFSLYALDPVDEPQGEKT